MQNSDPNQIRLRVEGWRGISHSFALVNQFQLLHWKKSGKTAIEHLDMPYFRQNWSKDNNFAGFNEYDRAVIENISETTQPNAVYRIFAPFTLKTPVELPTVTFAVTEWGLNANNYIQSDVDCYAKNGGKIHTPSHWSKKRLVAQGVPESIIHVIPHGVDKSYFFKLNTDLLEHHRNVAGYTPDDIIILNVGGHFTNKGLDLLIVAFAIARKKNKNLKLLIKDQKLLYSVDSIQFVLDTLKNKGIHDEETINSIRFISAQLNLKQLNLLYNIADIYATPYRAEGFNLPALEAQACGTPVMATAGGATDDFLTQSNNFFISGQLFENSNLIDNPKINSYIEPNLSEIIETLEGIGRKQNISQNSETFDWSDACKSINKLFV